MIPRRVALSTLVLFCILQLADPNWHIPLANSASASGLMTLTPSQTLDPPYLGEMPSVDKVMQAMKTTDPAATALRQIGAFYQLVEIIKTLSGRREFRGFSPDEARIIGAYQVAEFNVTQAADKTFPAPSGFRTFSAQMPYRFGRSDRRFGNEGIETFKMFLSPALKAKFDAIVAADSARREARNQSEAPAAVQPVPAAKTANQAELRKCFESGRSKRVCMSESLNAGLYELAGVNLRTGDASGLRMTGDYAGATDFRLIFLPTKVSMICRGVPTQQPYTVEASGAQAVVKIEHNPGPVVFSLRADGKLAGSGRIRITGQVPSGTRTEETMGMTTQQTTRTRELSPGEQRNYPNATRNGNVWTVKEDASELVYGPTGTRTVTDYVTKTADCTLGLMSPSGATPLPPDMESPFGIIMSVLSGAGTLMKGGSGEDALRDMLDLDNAPPPGLRMIGNYVGQNGFSIKFHPESATVSCGEAARALRYSVERNTNQMLLKLQDKTNPITLQMKPDGTLFGEGTVQVDGRMIVGTTEDPDNPFVYAPRVRRCPVGNLVAGGSAAASTSSPVSRPTTTPPTTAAIDSQPSASLSITSGFATAPGTPNPLAGKSVIILRESFETILARAGFSPPGSRASALTVWARACETRAPACQKGIEEMRPYFVSSARLDNSGGHTFQNARAGTYYLVLQINYNGIHLVWNLRMDLRAGSNLVKLDERNVAPIN